MKNVIIGCGPAAIAAAETIRSVSPRAGITVISDEARPLYSRCLISYALIFSGELDISYRGDDFFSGLRVTPILGRRAVSISPSERTVVLDCGDRVPYDRLLIATGGNPTMPAVPGAEKKGVLGFRTTAHLAEIRDLLPSTRSAVVLGGGCIGLQVATGLMAAGVKVTIAIKSAHLLSRVADETAGALYARLFRENGAEVVTGVGVASIDGGERVERVTMDDGSEIECQLVAVGKGVTPNAEIARAAGVRCGRGIIVDELMTTSIPDIYAAGDVAETRDMATCESTVNALWPCASEQGRIAGFNMAGVRRVYEGSLRMNAVEFFGVPMISVGVVKGAPPRYEIFSSGGRETVAYRRLVFEGDVLKGALLIGDIANAGVLTSLIRKRAPLGAVKEDLIEGRCDFPRIVEAVRRNRERFREESYEETLLTMAKGTGKAPRDG